LYGRSLIQSSLFFKEHKKMGFLKRLAMLAGVIEPTTIDEKLDQIIADAVSNGFEVEYDDQEARFTDIVTRACYCADYVACPPSLNGARAWMDDRIAARRGGPQFPISAEALYQEGR
jgi:hypothetical protein